ncbi:ML domain-containing protein [Mycena indigotica]|uniref:Phosphatidylglycerol/phosphatidylinositol transfer protein n=1 Tax=Mycena indigotica TaxID=2126181 RepID=A0A8H6W5Y7_9AGAR|nr:ML domain-containing protein [Mycena indigotica]KAF7307004.1 ML domain-containing protein [Mycena indigotica]
MLLRIFALLVGFLNFVHAWEYVNCGTGLIDIESIVLQPEIPIAGEQLTVTIKGRATQTIEARATADVTVKLGLVKLIQKRFDVCAEVARLPGLGISCPVEDREWHTIQQTVTLPKEIPKSKFNIQVRGSTAKNEPMLCLDLKLDFMSSAGSIFRAPF